MEIMRELDVVRAGSRAPTTRSVDTAAMPEMEVRFSVFNSWYEIDSLWEGTFLERVSPGAFKRTINNSGHQVRALFNHGMDPAVGEQVLGPITSLTEESDSPVGIVRLLDTSYNRDLIPGLDAGVYGSSFRFRVVVDEWNDDPGVSTHNPRGIPERTLKEVRLYEFGPVTFPANPLSTAGLRSATDAYYEHLAASDPVLVAELRSRLKQTTNLDDTAEPGPVHDTPASALAVQSDPAARHSGTTEADRPTLIETPRSRNVMDLMTTEERATRQAEIRARLAEIDSEHAGAALPEETRAEWDRLNTEHDAHAAAIADSSARADRIRALADQPGHVERVGQGIATVSTARRADNIYDMSAIRQLARSVDELPGLYRDHAMRSLESARFGAGVDADQARRNVERLLHSVDDEQGSIARRMLVTGSPIYRKAFGKALVSQGNPGALTVEEQRALSLGTAAAGGYAVPYQLDPTIILTSNGATNPLRQVSRVEQITGKEWDGITSAGVTVSRSAEAAEAADNSPTLVQPTVKAERVQGFVPFSFEIEQDWSGLLDSITSMLTDAKDVEEATAFVTGTGVSPDANGLLTTLNASSNVIANTFTLGSLYTLQGSLPARFRGNASFLASLDIYNAVRQFDTAGGAALWEYLANEVPDRLLGRRAFESSVMPDATLSIGDKYLVYGDFRNFLIVDRVGMIVSHVPHLFGANRRPTGQAGIYALWRNNCKVLVDNAFRTLFKAA